jgi:hypothetical protein
MVASEVIAELSWQMTWNTFSQFDDAYRRASSRSIGKGTPPKPGADEGSYRGVLPFRRRTKVTTIRDTYDRLGP